MSERRYRPCLLAVSMFSVVTVSVCDNWCSFGVLGFKLPVCCIQGDLEKTAQVESCVIDCLLAMVMKLSEVTFRPLFFKVTSLC